MQHFAQRKWPRLKNYDYSSEGFYFITICTKNRKRFLSRIEPTPGETARLLLSEYGHVVESYLVSFPGIEKYVIMPNHIHLLVSIRDLSGGASPSPTVGTEAFSAEGDVLPSLFDVARVLKSLTSRMARPFLGESPLWQRSYHEHVIRNEDDYRQVWEYIDTNPAKWAEDRYYKGKRD